MGIIMQDDKKNTSKSPKQIGIIILLIALAFITYYLYFKYFYKGGSYQ